MSWRREEITSVLAESLAFVNDWHEIKDGSGQTIVLRMKRVFLTQYEALIDRPALFERIQKFKDFLSTVIPEEGQGKVRLYAQPVSQDECPVIGLPGRSHGQSRMALTALTTVSDKTSLPNTSM